MSMNPTSSAHRRQKTGWLLLAAVIVLVVIGAWITVQARGRSRRQTAIDHVIIAHEALLPAQLEVPADRRGKDPSEWLARVANVHNAWDMSAIADAHTYNTLLESGRAGRHGENGRVAFERFEACMGPWLAEQKDAAQKDIVEAWSMYWVDMAARLQEANGTIEWRECAQAAVQLLAAGLEPSMKLAREAAAYGAIDPKHVGAQLDAQDEPFPRLPVIEEARLADAVHVTAMFDAHAQRYGDALDDVRAGLAVARIHQPSDWVLSNMLWVLHVRRALDTLQMILPQLPRGLEVADIEAQLTAMSPGDELAHALKGERAFGNRVFESMRNGWRPPGGAAFAPSSLLSGVQRWLVGDADQAAYLEAMAQEIEIVSHPAFLRRDLPAHPTAGFWTPATSVVLPALASPLSTVDVLEARLALARVALTAYRAGAKDALTFLSKSVDPFDGQPIRCAFGDKGLIVFWSVGPDHRDNSATTGSDDIVWPLRLRD
jgi:hypothetical protein